MPKLTRKQAIVLPGKLWCVYGQHHATEDQFRRYASHNYNPHHTCKACERQRSKDSWLKLKQTEIPYRLLSPIAFF